MSPDKYALRPLMNDGKTVVAILRKIALYLIFYLSASGYPASASAVSILKTTSFPERLCL